MKIRRGWGLRDGTGGERQDANQEKSKSHFVSSFYLSILLLPGQHQTELRSVHAYGQSIHPWPSPNKSYRYVAEGQKRSISGPERATECPFCCIQQEACTHSRGVIQVDIRGGLRCNVAFHSEIRR